MFQPAHPTKRTGGSPVANRPERCHPRRAGLPSPVGPVYKDLAALSKTDRKSQYSHCWHPGAFLQKP